MKNGTPRILDEFTEYECFYGFKSKEYCTPQEAADYQRMVEKGMDLPDGVFFDKGQKQETGFFRIKDNDVSDDRKKMMFIFKGLDEVRKIRGYLYFFVILTILSLIASAVASILSILH